VAPETRSQEEVKKGKTKRGEVTEADDRRGLEFEIKAGVTSYLHSSRFYQCFYA